MGTAKRWAWQVASWWPILAFAVWLALAAGGWVVGRRRGWGLGELLFAESLWLLALMLVARDAVRNLFGPVFVYELVRVGRRRMTFILRALYVMGICAILALMYVTFLERLYYANRYSLANVPPSAISRFATEFFETYVIVQYLVIVLLTPAYVAGTVADEKERKTLEFLLATDLQNREIIFGKLAARMANLLMLVLAGLPLLAMMQLFGGIDPELVLAATAATSITMFGIATVSIYQSTVVRKPRDAIMLTYLLVAVYVILTAFVAGYTTNVLGPQGYAIIHLAGYEIDLEPIAEESASGNLPYLLLSSMSSRRATTFGPDDVGDLLTRHAVFWGIVGSLLVGLATLRLRTVALAEKTGGRSLFFRGGKSSTVSRSRPEVGDDPMFWKEVFVESGFRGGCGGFFMGMIFVGLTFLFPVLIVGSHFGDLILTKIADAYPGLQLRETLSPMWFVGSGYRDSFEARWENFVDAMNAWVRGATGVLGGLILMGAAVRGASCVSGERDKDTWISLISTPLSGTEMVLGKWWGVVLGMRKGYWLLLVVWGTGLVVGAVRPAMVLLTMVSLAVYVSAFAWIGVRCSINARTSLIATIRAFLTAAFFCGGFWPFLGLCCGAPLGAIMQSREEREFVENFGILLLGCTPPFVLGWLPLNSFEIRELSPFQWQDSKWFGPFAPLFGVCLWTIFAFWLGIRSISAFDYASNRVRLYRRPTPPRGFE